MKGRTVLVVEDDAAVAAAVVDSLGSSQLRAEVAATLAQALARLRADGVGCVLLDLVLPDARGVEAVAAVQAAAPRVPIIVLTGHPDLEAAALLAGAQEVVVKPASASTLARAISTAARRHEVRHDYRPYTDALAAAVESVDKLEQIKDAGTPPPPPETTS